MDRRHLFLAAALTAVATLPAPGQAPAPPTDLEASDHWFDGGQKIDLAWMLSADDQPGADNPVSHYVVTRSSEPNGRYVHVIRLETVAETYAPNSMARRLHRLVPRRMEYTAESEPDQEYWFRVSAVGRDGAKSEIAQVGPVVSTRQGFDGSRFWMGVITLILCGAVIYWIWHARKGKPIRVRKIAGLEAVDEAVGRATEMGRSVLFIPGIQDMNDIQTIAGITVMARVAKTAAEYDAKLEVPTSRALVMTASRETIQAAFLAAGRPDLYNEDLIYYVTDEQFGYVAYLQGMMVREKPAACFYMGSFFAESLILAETGNSIGAIQVAGTAQPAQLPFFVAACDYTLIGEEFFAASAYLSGSPEELGSLKGQDVGKIVVAIGLVVGISLATIAMITKSEEVATLAAFIRDTVMT